MDKQPMSDFGKHLFGVLQDANAAAAQHIGIGRAQMARDVSGIIGTLSAHKGPMQVINELIALCRKEA